MMVSWCAIHNQSAFDYIGDRAVGCPSADDIGDCSMVEALLIVKDAATGGWPEDILRVGDNYAGRIGTGLFLDALASVGGETS